MIEINRKIDCCGCNACVQRCPKQCISMFEDDGGFMYPKVNLDLCIHCNLCEKVCPVINQNENRHPLKVYAAKNKNVTIRRCSSSGGIFTMLAEHVIDEGGVVFGAKWDKSDWSVVHDFTENKEGLSAFRSSKYLQSRVGDSFKKTEVFLKKGRKVLFTGTPCQIAGLNHFLRKKYDNLVTCEIFCHSVPSPKYWHIYLDECLLKLGWSRDSVENINFRSKVNGWKNYHFMIKNKNGELFDQVASKNHFMQGFLAGFYTRPSCHACPAKKLRSGSDLTIGDYWGIQHINPIFDDDLGVSAVLVNTIQGEKILSSLNFEYLKMDYEGICKYNPAIIQSATVSDKADMFSLTDEGSFCFEIDRICKKSLFLRTKIKFSSILHRLLKFL